MFCNVSRLLSVTIFLAALSGALTTPSRAETAAVPLRIGLSGEVTSLDPHALAAQPNLTVSRHVFESLTDVDDKARIIPGLAQSWRALDELTWEFVLRDNVKFHDGSPLTAEDVKFSLERPLTIPAGGFASYVRSISRIDISGTNRLRITTRYPYGALPEDLNSILIISKKRAGSARAADFDSGSAMIGTGPFRFVRYERGDRLELARHEQWWKGKPAWPKVTLRIIPADPTRTAGLLTGELDLIEHVPPADLKRIRQEKRLRVIETTSWRTLMLHVDQYREVPPGISGPDGKPLATNPMKDLRVRQALSLAISRDALAKRVMEGLAVPASNIVSPGIFGHDKNLPALPYDPARAKQLLAEAGYPRGFRMTLAGPNNRYINDEQVLQSVAQLFSRIGIQTRVEAAPMSVYLARVRREETSVSLLGWGSFAADLALRSLIATRDPDKGYGTWNWGRYSNGRVDERVTRALASVDREERESLAREANALTIRDLGIIPLYHQVVSWGMRNGIDYLPRTDEFTLAQYVKQR
jgi:peptide/nickel transport system substrate-binding protein